MEWSAVAGATGYQVWFGIESSSNSANQSGGDVTATSNTITGLNNDHIWVKAKNNSELSDFSSPDSGTPKTPSAPPEAPAAPVLTLENNYINVTWTLVAGATGYEVHYFADGSEILYTNYNTSGNSYTIPLPDYGTVTYAVWIIAKNNAGKSGKAHQPVSRLLLISEKIPAESVLMQMVLGYLLVRLSSPLR